MNISIIDACRLALSTASAFLIGHRVKQIVHYDHLNKDLEYVEEAVCYIEGGRFPFNELLIEKGNEGLNCRHVKIVNITALVNGVEELDGARNFREGAELTDIL